MDQLGAMRAFVRVVQVHSFSAAAANKIQLKRQSVKKLLR